jgi:hypothetical protein
LITPAVLRARTLPLLLVSTETQWGSRGPRRDLAMVYRLLDVLKDDGLDLESMRGPWQAGTDSWEWRGRPRRRSCCFAELGRVRVYVDSQGRARELAGLLNWCEVAEEELSGVAT